MRQKFLFLSDLTLFLPLISPNAIIQTISITNNSISQSEESSNNFYVYEGNTNNLISYLNETNQAHFLCIPTI